MPGDVLAAELRAAGEVRDGGRAAPVGAGSGAGGAGGQAASPEHGHQQLLPAPQHVHHQPIRQAAVRLHPQHRLPDLGPPPEQHCIGSPLQACPPGTCRSGWLQRFPGGRAAVAWCCSVKPTRNCSTTLIHALGRCVSVRSVCSGRQDVPSITPGLVRGLPAVGHQETLPCTPNVLLLRTQRLQEASH